MQDTKMIGSRLDFMRAIGWTTLNSPEGVVMVKRVEVPDFKKEGKTVRFGTINSYDLGVYIPFKDMLEYNGVFHTWDSPQALLSAMYMEEDISYLVDKLVSDIIAGNPVAEVFENKLRI